MKNTAKLIAISIFALGALFTFLSSNGFSRIGAAAFSGVRAGATPPKNKNANAKPTPAMTASPTKTAAPMMTAQPSKTGMPSMTAPPTAAPTSSGGTTGPPSGGKTIPKSFTLAKDSQSEYGEVAFDHDSHAFKNYSPDGKSTIACTECHHTDQPKSNMKPPDVTSERSEILTFDVFQKSSQKVSECRTCHFQDGNVPDGKTMPTAGGKEYNNQIAYHVNCNTCHDAAYKARPELKTHKGFATGKDCGVCHKTS